MKERECFCENCQRVLAIEKELEKKKLDDENKQLWEKICAKPDKFGFVDHLTLFLHNLLTFPFRFL